MHPLISICIPTYNRAELLDYCLENLAALKDCGRPVEIVISDNGSTDRTPEVIEAHSRPQSADARASGCRRTAARRPTGSTPCARPRASSWSISPTTTR